MRTTRSLGLAASCTVIALVAATACSDDTATVPSEPDTTAASVPATEPAPSTEPEPEPEQTDGSSPAPSADTVAPEPRTYDFSAVAPIVQDFVDDEGLNGAGLVVVDRDDGIVHEQYWGEFGADRISLIASSSKMLTAGVLMRLHDDGVLDLDAPVADVVDWGAGNPDITPAQLVSNSSGLVGLLPNPVYLPYLCQFALDDTLQRCAEHVMSTPDDDADIVPPDSEFRYGGAQWQVAGALAEVASGSTWAELIDEIYAQPCGVGSLGYTSPFAQFDTVQFDYPAAFGGDLSRLTPTGNPNMEGGAYIDPVDYAALLLMHLRGGVCGDNRVLSTEAIDRMHRDRIAEVYGGVGLAGSGYGLGWWVDRASGRLTDPGAYGAFPWLDLDGGYGAYLVLEADALTGAALAGRLFDVVDDAIRSA